jgi:anti-sigma factor RsiW
MTCESTMARLVADLDGELTPEESAAVRDHLATCESCRAERLQLETVVRAAAAWDTDASDIWPTVHGAMQSVGPDPVLQELRAMRAEIATLREEIAALRRDARIGPPALVAGRLLLAFAPADEPALTIM